MQAIIFANGDFVPPPDLDKLLAAAELVIAADGGSQHCRALGLRPDFVIGDLDSMDAVLRTDWESNSVHFISFPAEKDQTDLELALLHAKAAGAKKVMVLGALGRRWDHSIANLLLLGNPQFHDLKIIFLHDEQQLFAINGKLPLKANIGERVSLMALSGDAMGISTHGLKYPMNGETLPFGSSRGVSNVVLAEGSDVVVKTGTLLCVISPADTE